MRPAFTLLALLTLLLAACGRTAKDHASCGDDGGASVPALASSLPATAVAQSEWIIVADALPPMILLRGRESALGERDGWKCFAKLTHGKDGDKTGDTVDVRCSGPSTSVHVGIVHVDGTPFPEPTPFQIMSADGTKPIRTLMIGVH